jgi:hypothetical protein
MMHTQMVQTLILYVLLSAGLAGTLLLFGSVKREIHAHAAKNRKRMEELAKTLAQAPTTEPEPAFIPAPARSGLNISKRVQAMRMMRRNEDVSHIAAALGVTRREVELLVRVHQIKPQV